MRRFAPLALLIAFAACFPSDTPGDPYGVYAVVGTLRVNECGQDAAPVQLPYQRVYELYRQDTGVAQLMGSDGSVINGSIGKEGTFQFSSQSAIRMIEPDEIFGIRGCDLVVALTIEGKAVRKKVSGEDEEEEYELEPLEGTLTTRFTPAPGSDCSELLYGSASGGRFHALPCRVILDLEGEPVVEEALAGQ